MTVVATAAATTTTGGTGSGCGCSLRTGLSLGLRTRLRLRARLLSCLRTRLLLGLRASLWLVGCGGTGGVLHVRLRARCGASCLYGLRVVRMRQGLMEGLSAGARGCGYGGIAVVYRGELRAVGGSGLLVLLL